jgi:hypothetical protein
MREFRAFVLAGVVLMAPLAMANHFADLYIIPAAIHSTTSGGTFVSDLALQNFQPTPLDVDILFIQSGEGNGENVSALVSRTIPNGRVTVPAGGSVVLRDILDGFDGATNPFGALIVSAQRAFALTSRAYSPASGGGTFGQTVPPVRDFIDNTLGDTANDGAVSYLPGLTHNASFRTNLGFVAGAGRTGMTLEVTLRGANGASLGTRGFAIPANTFVHSQFSTVSVANANYDAAGAEFRITTGDGAVTPYASVVDNRTNDAVFISGVFPPNAPFAIRTPSIFQQLVEAHRQSR